MPLQRALPLLQHTSISKLTPHQCSKARPPKLLLSPHAPSPPVQARRAVLTIICPAYPRLSALMHPVNLHPSLCLGRTSYLLFSAERHPTHTLHPTVRSLQGPLFWTALWDEDGKRGMKLNK